MLSRTSRTLALGSGALALLLAGAIAPAQAEIGDVDPLVACSDGSSGTDLGDVKFSPGLQTVEKKNTITAAFAVPGCTADEADLDEIASESKFGVSKTAAGGRGAIVSGTAKAKFFAYGDCLGLVLMNDPDNTGEYPAVYGTIQVQWLDALGKKPGKSAAFVVLDAGVGAVLTGFVTKGLGVGGALDATAGFAPKTDGSDDDNENMVPDFIDCALSADPTAKAKLLDVVTPSSLDITL